MRPQRNSNFGRGAPAARPSNVRRSVSPQSRSGAMLPPTTRPSAVARTLNTGPTAPTERGRAIAKDMQDLADDFYGEETGHALPPVRGNDGGFGSAYSKSKGSYAANAVPPSWKKGPTDPAGRLFDASNSNLLCMDVNLTVRGKVGPLCVVGSADHGLKVFDISTMKEKKNLYNKTNGHTEWVTSCKFLPDGRVVSGGMDSKLCLWENVATGGPARAQDLLAHTGSISQVDANEAGRVISSSYDRTLRVWDCSSGYGTEVGCLAGHKGPVMQFDWCGTQVLSGDRQGSAKVWDLTTSSCVCTMATKRGQIGALGHLMSDDVGFLTLFGDQGGVLTAVDLRQSKRPICQQEVHPGGVLSGIRVIQQTPYVVTSGADRRVVVMDPRRNFEAVHVFTDHRDFIYSLETFGTLVLSGGGNGWLMVHDAITGKCCYGLGANEAAVREIFCSPEYLVAAGDDGKAAVYTYF